MRQPVPNIGETTEPLARNTRVRRKRTRSCPTPCLAPPVPSHRPPSQRPPFRRRPVVPSTRSRRTAPSSAGSSPDLDGNGGLFGGQIAAIMGNEDRAETVADQDRAGMGLDRLHQPRLPLAAGRTRPIRLRHEDGVVDLRKPVVLPMSGSGAVKTGNDQRGHGKPRRSEGACPRRGSPFPHFGGRLRPGQGPAFQMSDEAGGRRSQIRERSGFSSASGMNEHPPRWCCGGRGRVGDRIRRTRNRSPRCDRRRCPSGTGCRRDRRRSGWCRRLRRRRARRPRWRRRA